MPSKISVDKSVAEDVAHILDEQKAVDVELYDVQGKIPYADFIIIATANSGMHAKALTKHIVKGLKEMDISPINQTKKLDNEDWVVLDYGVLVVHLFQEVTRVQYNLEEIYQKSKNTE